MNTTQASKVIECNAIRLAAREPHKAMAGHVDAHGSEQAKALYELAQLYDRQYFGGQLGALFIEIAAPASPSALATHQPVSPEGVAMVIRIAPSVVDSGPALAADALLHEMIHAWQRVADKSEPGYAGHGPEFAAKCNEIGAQLGLAPVGVKGRANLPDCAQWPLNVRPDGYYGEAPRAAKAVARATKARTRARSGRTAAPADVQARQVDPQAEARLWLLACDPEQRAAVLLSLGLAACPA
jgi:hypothetical protein